VFGTGPKSDHKFRTGSETEELTEIFKGYFTRTSPAESFNRRLLIAYLSLKDNILMHRHQLTLDNLMSYTRVYWMERKMKEAAPALAAELSAPVSGGNGGPVVGEITGDTGIIDK